MSYSLQEAYLSIYSEEFKDLTPDKSERVKARHAELVSGVVKDHEEVNKLRKKPFLRYRSGTKQKIRELIGRIKKNATLAQNAGDALIRTSVSKEAKLKYLKNKISELEPKNKIIKFQREEIELILNYLLDGGYADSFDTAELIFENMSDEWLENILSEDGEVGLRMWQPNTNLSPAQRFFAGGVSDYPGRFRVVPINTPLNRSSYLDRAFSGRNISYLDKKSNYADNLNYIGPMRRTGSGTRDTRMPGTTSSQRPYLSTPRYNTKYPSPTLSPAQRTYGRNLGYT